MKSGKPRVLQYQVVRCIQVHEPFSLEDSSAEVAWLTYPEYLNAYGVPPLSPLQGDSKHVLNSIYPLGFASLTCF